MTSAPKKSEQMRIPDGTVEEILDWVKNDPQRAFLALQVEQGKEAPRIPLVEGLMMMAYDPDGLYVYVGPQELYYTGYSFEDAEGNNLPAHAVPKMDPVMFTPAGGQDMPIPPRDGNWVPHSGKIAPKKPDTPDQTKD